MKRKNKILDWIWDLIFPRHCPVCDELLRFRKERVCRTCLGKIKFIREPACMKCGKQLQETEQEYCYDCGRKKHFFIRGTAVFEYHGMAASIYRFKYKGRQEYAEFYGKCMAQAFKEKAWMKQAEALVPVPIHSSRKRMRGYNQALLLAEALSRETGIPVRADLIRRCRKTVPQKELDDAGRQNNLKRAFKICRNDVKLNTIIIIDDIYTTGTTIDTMSVELQKAGIADIYYAALAIGKGL